MASSGYCASDLIERVRVEIRDVQKSALEFSRWLCVITIRVSLGSLDLGRTFTKKSTTMEDSRGRKKTKTKKNKKQRKLKLTHRSEYIDIVLVKVDWNLNLNRRAQDPTQPEVERKPCHESPTHDGIADVVYSIVVCRMFDKRREIKK
jgi:hypothetical protein